MDDLRSRFAGDDEAARDPDILIKAYTELAVACRKAGEVEEADRYEANVEMLQRRKSSR